MPLKKNCQYDLFSKFDAKIQLPALAWCMHLVSPGRQFCSGWGLSGPSLDTPMVAESPSPLHIAHPGRMA
jgi:hypothetical protein